MNRASVIGGFFGVLALAALPGAARALSCAFPYTGEAAPLTLLSVTQDGEAVDISDLDAYRWRLESGTQETINLSAVDAGERHQGTLFLEAVR